MGLHNILRKLGGYNMMKMVRKKANFLQHWVPTRHMVTFIIGSCLDGANYGTTTQAMIPHHHSRRLGLPDGYQKPSLLNPSHQNNSYREEAIRQRTNLEILLQVPNFQRQRSTYFSLHFLPEIWILQWCKVRGNPTQLYNLFFKSKDQRQKRLIFQWNKYQAPVAF